jgi:hypothetical protein
VEDIIGWINNKIMLPYFRLAAAHHFEYYATEKFLGAQPVAQQTRPLTFSLEEWEKFKNHQYTSV